MREAWVVVGLVQDLAEKTLELISRPAHAFSAAFRISRVSSWYSSKLPL